MANLFPDRQFFGAYYPRRWRDAKALADEMTYPYAFRGQRNADWGLSTSIERVALRCGLPRPEIWRQESWILHDFSRRAHHFVADPPEGDGLLDWLALIQHHGGPTRLLDFTHSFYVAAYFAMSEAECDAAVWAVDLSAIARVVADQHPDLQPVGFDRREVMEKHIAHCEAVLRHTQPVPGVVDVEPMRMNLRLASQQGLFLVPASTSISFEDNLFATFNVSSDVVKDAPLLEWSTGDAFDAPLVAKIVLPQPVHGNAINDLHSMNVHALSLLGGLDGLGRSMGRFLTVLDPDA